MGHTADDADVHAGDDAAAYVAAAAAHDAELNDGYAVAESQFATTGITNAARTTNDAVAANVPIAAIVTNADGAADVTHARNATAAADGHRANVYALPVQPIFNVRQWRIQWPAIHTDERQR